MLLIFYDLVAPLKALCTEKFSEWSEKFEKDFNLKCIELTGDTDNDDENDWSYIENANIICTTPVSFNLHDVYMIHLFFFYLHFSIKKN